MLKINEEEVVTEITQFIKEYAEKAGKNRIVIGLSGGIDSSLIAKLASISIGNENVFTIFLPETATPLNDFEHSRMIAKNLNVSYEIIDISSIIHSLVSHEEEINRIALGNIKARIRMVYLYKYANKIDALVCGTSNKTELLLGYFTKYGDGGSDFMPIGDLYKTQVYQIARYLKLPEEIINKPPTAGLWKGQTDEKELGLSYEKIDKILYGIETKMELKKIADFAGVDIKEVERIYEMVRKNEHKRRLPPIPKVGFKTVGIDWRFPLQMK